MTLLRPRTPPPDQPAMFPPPIRGALLNGPSGVPILRDEELSLFRQRIRATAVGEIGVLIRRLTYADMMELASKLNKVLLAQTTGTQSSESIAAALYSFAESERAVHEEPKAPKERGASNGS